MAETVGGATGSEEIASMWKDHYHNLLNLVLIQSLKADVLESVENEVVKDEYLFTCKDVKEGVNHLQRGQSDGHVSRNRVCNV